MHLLEDSTEKEVARMEGVAAGTLSSPGRRHEIENIMVMGSKELGKDNIWVQVVIITGLAAARQQRKQVTAKYRQRSSPEAIAPKYV